MITEHFSSLCKAIKKKKQIMFKYKGHDRKVCPYVLGKTNDKEMLLGFQFAGSSSSGLPDGGDWRCFKVEEISNLSLVDGAWYGNSQSLERQKCVNNIDCTVDNK